MVTIDAYAKVKGRIIHWLFDGNSEEDAEKTAKRSFKKKGLEYIDYILV